MSEYLALDAGLAAALEAERILQREQQRLLAAVGDDDASQNGHGDVSLLTSFHLIEAVPVRWLWPDRIALGKITGLAGRPKIGKGLLYSRLISELTHGKLDGDVREPRNAIIVTTEDDPGDTLKPRLMAAGADVRRVYSFQMGSEKEPVPFRIPQDVEELSRRIKQTNAALVVVDPLMEFIDAKTDAHKSQPVRQALAALNALARETGVAVVVIVHLNKGTSTDPLIRHEGSAAFTQVLRGAMLLGHDPDDPEGERGSKRVLVVSSSNLAQPAPSLLYEIRTATVWGANDAEITTADITRIGESNAVSSDLLRTTRDDDDGSAIEEATEFVVVTLDLGPKAAKDLEAEARQIGISSRTLERARAKLRKDGIIDRSKTGFHGGWEWFLHSPPTPPSDVGGVR
jgi:AAA domain